MMDERDKSGSRLSAKRRKPAGKSAGKSSGKSSGKFAEKSTGKPAEKSTGKPAGKPSGKSAGKSVKKDHPFEKFKTAKTSGAEKVSGGRSKNEKESKPGRAEFQGPKTKPARQETPRLNRFIAKSGLCSRRDADEYILAGHIEVNGKIVKEVGTKVAWSDVVKFKGRKLSPENKIYLLLNKPKDYITTVDDPYAKRTVMDLVRNSCRERIYPVGRLDRHTTGLLLFTNDGELTKKLTHPSHKVMKIYQATLDRPLERADMEKIAAGIELEDGPVHADEISWVDEKDKSLVGIQLHSGKNRIIRRIFKHLDYKVLKLDRVFFAGLTKKNLPRGKWRFLEVKEINRLKMNIFG
jgi:23S rRNA pseudouridine2605 synthase